MMKIIEDEWWRFIEDTWFRFIEDEWYIFIEDEWFRLLKMNDSDYWRWMIQIIEDERWKMDDLWFIAW
jgi:hypothetical protein